MDSWCLLIPKQHRYRPSYWARLAPDVTPQNAASHLGLFYLLTGNSSKNEIIMKKTPDAPKNENGLIQMIRMGKSIRLKWVYDYKVPYLVMLLDYGRKHIP